MRASRRLDHLHFKPLFGEVSLVLCDIQRQITDQVYRLGNHQLLCLHLRVRGTGRAAAGQQRDRCACQDSQQAPACVFEMKSFHTVPPKLYD